MKVLIIDDSVVMRRLHKNILVERVKMADEDFFEAADGVEALKIAEREDIDLFLVDWNMPKLDGVQFVVTLRQKPRYEKTPVIMITSEAAKYNVMEAIKAGVTNYVVKPIKGDALWEKIAKYAGGVA